MFQVLRYPAALGGCQLHVSRMFQAPRPADIFLCQYLSCYNQIAYTVAPVMDREII